MRIVSIANPMESKFKRANNKMSVIIRVLRLHDITVEIKIASRLFYHGLQLITIRSGHRAGTGCGIGHTCYMNKLSSRRRIT